VERWRKISCVAIGVLALSVCLPWLTVTLNLSEIERGTQQYSILGVSITTLSPSASGSTFVSTPYFMGLFDVPYFTLSALLLLVALVSGLTSIVLRKPRLQLLAAAAALTAAWYWVNVVKRLDDYLYLRNYLASGMCYINSEWLRCVSAEVGIGAYVALAVGLVLLASWLLGNSMSAPPPLPRRTGYADRN
jgi:hypothetical protein